MSSKFEFQYSNSRIPSLPLFDIEVISFFDKTMPDKIKGKIDTGADGTSIPENLILPLDLKKTGEIWIKDANGGRKKRNTYEVIIKIGEIKFGLLRVSASPRDNVLIGRDLINLWNLKLDGQNHIGELVAWSTDPEDAK